MVSSNTVSAGSLYMTGEHIQRQMSDSETEATWAMARELFERQRLSRHYQESLETRIRNEQVACREAQERCTYLEKVILESASARSQQDWTLARVLESRNALSEEVQKEKEKVQSLGSCLVYQHKVNELLLQKIYQQAPTESEMLHLRQAQFENESQRQYIYALQSALDAQKQQIQSIKEDKRFPTQQSFVCCCCACDTEAPSNEVDPALPEHNPSDDFP
ncbi:hypothetical protein BO82DRAFT_417236 [Aspergillus uvarum CBS 121591]|uniref:Uncharacterized protein n=1 Tax=Aspergillus uvarum CBS 121591 TaxID=1448315 RepID=A0A319C9P5_9EURO|nr:hypothetical protein BO82DRAFT_417236 [Aspergillus uvarum CBS 121591]PYH80591.1 hypothetical protein BO82DRAFT_417236 [Aspergillus uvarum CBS 121591]